MPWTMYNREGQRKYLTKAETQSFLVAAANRNELVHSFCWVIAVTGCRISEALALTEKNIDFEAQHIVIHSLKKRGKRVFRAIPVPSNLLNKLKKWLAIGALSGERLWPWSRMTGYRRICEVMKAAGICGSYATPKGLRHGFGVAATQSSVPLTLVQRWLGHADIKTTAIYTSAMGPEERELAARMWDGWGDAPATPARRRPGQSTAQSNENHGRSEAKQRDACPSCRVDSQQESPIEEASFRCGPSMPERGGEPGVKAPKTISTCGLIHFWLFGLRPRLSACRVDGGEHGRWLGSKGGAPWRDHPSVQAARVAV